MKKAEVRFENITKKFNETTAVDNVSCKFEAGTLTTLLGPSGCGKTTSLRIIAGLERATSGKILVDDEDVTLLPATDRDVSMVFQSYALFPHMSVIENVSYGLKMINVNKLSTPLSVCSRGPCSGENILSLHCEIYGSRRSMPTPAVDMRNL